MPVNIVPRHHRSHALLSHPMCRLFGCLSVAVALWGAAIPRAAAQATLPRSGLQRPQHPAQSLQAQVPYSPLRAMLAPHPAAPAAPRPLTRLLVKLKPGVDFRAFAQQFSAAARSNTGRNAANAYAANIPPLRYVRSHDAIGWSTYEVPTAERLQPTIDALRKDARVLYAEPDYPLMRLSLSPPNNHYWGLVDWEHTYAVWGLGDSDEATAQGDDSTTWNYSWSQEQVSAYQAWSIYPGHYQTASERKNLLQTSPAKLTVVGDIDTGADLTHPNFSYTGNPSGGIVDTDVRNGGQLDIAFARSFVGPSFDGYQGDDPTLAMDDFGHGTGTAGLIVSAPNTGGNDAAFVAAHSGLTWDPVSEQVYPSAVPGIGFPAQLVPIKVLDAAGDGSEADMIDAILYASADWTDPNTGITHTSPHCLILNMSLALNTTNYPQALQDAVDFAWNHGTLIVAAAGNDGDTSNGGSGPNTPRYPARCDKVLAIYATTYNYPDGGVPETIAVYSNYGDQLGVGAPGGDYGQQYINNAPNAIIDPIPEFIFPLSLQPSYTAVMNDPNGATADSQYAQLGFAGPCLGEIPGTSFAAPQVTGLAALYASKHQITQSTPNAPQQIVNAIERGADSLNGLSNGGYDPESGWGRINAAATVQDLNNRSATVGGCIGRVRYIDTVEGNITVNGQAVSGGTTYNATSDPDGLYHLENLPAAAGGTVYNVTTTIFGKTATTQVTILPGCDQLGINLTPGGAASVTLKSVTLQPKSVLGSQNVTGTVTLSQAAATALTINLSSNNSAAQVPASVTIAAGSSSQTFTITTSVVSVKTVVTITASTNGATKQATLTVLPIGIQSLKLSPSSITGSLSALGTVTLQMPAAPGNITVNLSSADPSVAQPVDGSGNPLSSITISAGTQTGTFSIKTSAVTASTPVVIAASANGTTKNATLKVQPIGIKSFTLKSGSIKGGNSVTGTVTLAYPAAPGAITITFSSSNTTVVPTPASITIPAGSQTGTVTISTTAVTANTIVTVGAAANGSIKTVFLTVTP